MIDPKDIIQKIKEITAKDLQTMAKKYLRSERVAISLVGPHDKKQSKKILKILSTK